MDRGDPGAGQPVVVGVELVVDVAHRVSLGHQDHRVVLDGPLLARPQVQEAADAALDRQGQVLAENLDVEFGEPLPHPLFLQREAEVLAQAVPVGHVGDVAAPLGRELSHGAAHVVVVVVDDEHPPAEFLSVDDQLLGGADVGERRVGSRDRLVGGPVHAVGGPERAGGEDHVLGPVVGDIGGRQPGRSHELDVVQLVDLGLAPVDDPPPGAESGQGRHPADMTAHALVVVDDVDGLVAALAEHHGRLQASRSRADHQYGGVAVRGRGVVLGVPASPVLLAGGRVLGAPDGRAADLPARHADVAPDALPDVIEAALLDLAGEERIRDRRAGRPDDVALARRDGLDHHVGVGESADVDARLVGVPLGDAGVVGLMVGGEEPRRPGVLAPVEGADVEVPVVDEGIEGLDVLGSVLLGAEAGVAVAVGLVEGVDRHPDPDGAVVDRVAHHLQNLSGEAQTVL